MIFYLYLFVNLIIILTHFRDSQLLFTKLPFCYIYLSADLSLSPIASSPRRHLHPSTIFSDHDHQHLATGSTTAASPPPSLLYLLHPYLVRHRSCIVCGAPASHHWLHLTAATSLLRHCQNPSDLKRNSWMPKAATLPQQEWLNPSRAQLPPVPSQVLPNVLLLLNKPPRRCEFLSGRLPE